MADLAAEPDRKRGCGCGCGATGRRSMWAMEKYRVPSGSSITWRSSRSGVSKVECTFHNGQVPPNFETETCRRKTASRRAGIVDPQQEERRAAGVRPLQGGQAVADLLEAGIEALRQHLDVIAQRFRGGVKRLVGHHHGGGK